jgi:hypothetical protein
MLIRKAQGTSFNIELSADELVMLNNALNEVCNGIDIPEFSTRLGGEVDEVRVMLKQIAEALNTAQEET